MKTSIMSVGVRLLIAWIVCAVTVLGCGYLAPRKMSYGPVANEDGVLFRFYAPTARQVQLAG
ncbi:MAG: hypothetical protein JSW50_09265, partial [Candidatus Latescibacterota bacterium]